MAVTFMLERRRPPRIQKESLQGRRWQPCGDVGSPGKGAPPGQSGGLGHGSTGSPLPVSPVVIFTEPAPRHHHRVWHVDQRVAPRRALNLGVHLEGNRAASAEGTAASLGTPQPAEPWHLPACPAASTWRSGPGPRTATSHLKSSGGGGCCKGPRRSRRRPFKAPK